MILENTLRFPNHSSINKKARNAGYELQEDGFYHIPTNIAIELFPKSRVVSITYKCSKCLLDFKLAIGDFTGKKYKESCNICIKTKILIGENSFSFGKHHNLGVKKTIQHRKNMCGPRHSISGNKNPNWKHDTPEYVRYKGLVHRLSNKTYLKHEFEINPMRYIRTRCGVKDGWQLDHKKPIRVCFEENISPEEASRKENLQMLPWKENLMKSMELRA